MIRNSAQPENTIEQDPRWQAIVNRDDASDGQFYYGVLTTGVYCRPACPSRLPKAVNISFHDSCDAAEAAGFRPCKRCTPRAAPRAVYNAAVIAGICRQIEAAEEEIKLDELARMAGMSRFHFHRIFKNVTGLTPRLYAAAHRAKRVRDQLVKGGGTVTEAIYDAGYNSNGRFYEASNSILGMTPSRFRSGGDDMEIKFAIGECSLGSILVAQSDKGVCAILLGDDPNELAKQLQDSFPRARLIGGDADFESLIAKIIGFVEAPALGLNLPLDIKGTAFQQRVWQTLREIPAGKTASYTEIARRMGLPRAVRAVAGACAANRIAVAIPCHRVIRNDGALSGYRWGVERKRALLIKEAQQ